MSIGNLVFYVEKGKFMTSRQKQKKGSACLFLYWMWGRTMWIMWITWCITGFCEKKEVFLCGQKRNILSKESVDNVENVEKNLCSCAIC